MPSVITLQEAKDHLRVSHTDEDKKIWGYCMSAYNVIMHYIDDATVITGDSPLVYPDDIKEAAMMLVADSYEQTPDKSREAVHNKLYPYRQNIGI